jgi:hypothetical protein
MIRLPEQLTAWCPINAAGSLVGLKVWFLFVFDPRFQPLGHAFVVEGDQLAGFIKNRDAVVGIDEIHRVAALHA